ncbi:MAG: hypothetical protein AAFZ58_08720 [Pseudomonadota bacterium]
MDAVQHSRFQQRVAELRRPGTMTQGLRPMQDRRNDFDVTDSVNVSQTTTVRDEVKALFAAVYPDYAFDRLWLAFYDFERLFTGRYPGFLGCDTSYHDRQHTLDMTLAMARLIAGYEQSNELARSLGAERAELGIITSLFHDSGYIRHIERDRHFANGAEFTRWHVSRSAMFLAQYLPHIGLGENVLVARQIVHFTGYEIDLDQIELDDPRDSFLGHLLGTADLMAQMADRCYLEKCRDRLYAEFVVGGVAVSDDDGAVEVRYASAEDLLRKTPGFVVESAFFRLDKVFGKAYRYVEALFGGRNPYLEWIEHNLAHLRQMVADNDFGRLRREPPVFVAEQGSLDTLNDLVSEVEHRHQASSGQPSTA